MNLEGKGGKKEENYKRQREEGRLSEEGLNPFKRSVLVQRSPKKMGKEEVEDQNLMKLIHKNTSDTKEEVKGLRREIEEMREMMRKREEEWRKEKEELTTRMKRLEEKIEMKERAERKNNLVITGLQETGENLKEKVEKWVEKELDVKIEVKEAFKMGEGRLTLVKLEKWEQKREVMGRKSRLREKNVGTKIFIDDDLTKDERRIQKQLREFAREEREKGRRAKVGYKKVWIDGKCKKWDEESRGLKDMNF